MRSINDCVVGAHGDVPEMTPQRMSARTIAATMVTGIDI